MKKNKLKTYPPVTNTITTGTLTKKFQATIQLSSSEQQSIAITYATNAKMAMQKISQHFAPMRVTFKSVLQVDTIQ